MFAEYNPRRISAHDYEQLRWSIREFGYVQNVVVNKRTRGEGWPAGSSPTIVGGHQGVRASEDEGFEALPVYWVDLNKVREQKLNLILNRVGGEFVIDQVEEILRRLKDEGDPLEHVGFADEEIEAFLAGKSARAGLGDATARRTLHERFIVPPFSVLDARQGYWRERKIAWLALGIESELGRGAGAPGNAGEAASGVYADHGAGMMRGKKGFKAALAGGKNSVVEKVGVPGKRAKGRDGLLIRSDSGRDPTFYKQKRAAEARLGRKLSTEEFGRDYYVPNEGGSGLSVAGTSVFDPVLCELVYRWFCPPGGRVLDPFAGGSVRGIVAGMVGRRYLGIDLSAAQLEENRRQAEQIIGGPPPALDEETVSDPEALTPIQKVEGGVWLKRDDLLELAGVRGGKVRTCWSLAKEGAEGLVTAGSRSSPQVNIVAHVAAELGLPCRVHTPSGTIGPELEAAQAAGAELVQHKAGRNTVIVARARADAKESGFREIPFGMECQEAVEQTRLQVRRLPRAATRLVVSVGSGMTLAGILHGLRDTKRKLPVLGVRVGAAPSKRLDKYAPEGWREMVTLVDSGSGYSEPAEETERWGIEFDPHYEAKVLPFLEEGDLFWVVGIRQTATPALDTHPTALRPEWVQGDARELDRLVPRSTQSAPPPPTHWKFSAKILARPHDCSPSGIAKRCKGACCRKPLWPGQAGTSEEGCDLLGDDGSCTLAIPKRPVTCLLYPLRLNQNGTVILHHRARMQRHWCGGNYGEGRPLVDSLKRSLVEIVGGANYTKLRKAVAEGRDLTLEIEPAVAAALERERGWEAEGVPPDPRTREVPEAPGDGDVDLVFTCPPYYDLERYSDDPTDLSKAKTYEEFREAWAGILKAAAGRLREDRFLVVVVGEIRGAAGGGYRGLVPDTIKAGEAAGLRFYNDVVLVTPAGSLPVRAGKHFETTRKLGKTHQNVLVFLKGRFAEATKAIGAVEYGTDLDGVRREELDPPVV